MLDRGNYDRPYAQLTLKPFKHIFLLIPALCAGMFISCENDLEEVNKLTNFEVLPMQTVKNATFTYTDSAELVFKLEAPIIDRYGGEEPYDEFRQGVHVWSYDEQGNLETEITAAYAINYRSKKLMVAENNVELKNFEGKQLNAEELIWDQNTHRIYTDKFVKITTPREILFGDGLDAAEDFSSYEIKNIKGRIKVDEE